uniref:Uncharacterized protein n=1 Tax=Anopheles darlingi TaxID=43151 RepID=A0A2M4DKH2_ANODA
MFNACSGLRASLGFYSFSYSLELLLLFFVCLSISFASLFSATFYCASVHGHIKVEMRMVVVVVLCGAARAGCVAAKIFPPSCTTRFSFRSSVQPNPTNFPALSFSFLRILSFPSAFIFHSRLPSRVAASRRAFPST